MPYRVVIIGAGFGGIGIAKPWLTDSVPKAVLSEIRTCWLGVRGQAVRRWLSRARRAWKVSSLSRRRCRAGDGDAPVGRVEVIQRELPDRSRAGGVDRRQGDDQALRRADGHLLDGADLSGGHMER
jgi:hypothetical protein